MKGEKTESIAAHVCIYMYTSGSPDARIPPKKNEASENHRKKDLKLVNHIQRSPEEKTNKYAAQPAQENIP